MLGGGIGTGTATERGGGGGGGGSEQLKEAIDADIPSLTTYFSSIETQMS